MSNSRTFRRKTGETAGGEATIRVFEMIVPDPHERGENRGCNIGGSGLKPMRFPDGRPRNRAVPKVYKRQADGTYA